MSRTIYDSMYLVDKPTSAELGYIDFRGLYAWDLHGGASTPDPKDYTQPDETWYRYWARRMEDEGERLVWLNLEEWVFDEGESAAQNELYRQNKLDTLAIFRDEAPSVNWHAFNWRAEDQSIYYPISQGTVTDEQLATWRAFNDEYCLPVLESQNAIFPACYLRNGYTDEEWKRIEGTFTREIQRLVPSKPIYAVLRFHEANGYENPEDEPWVLATRMRMALNYLMSLGVDGIMLWSRLTSHYPEDEAPSWDAEEMQALWAVIEAWRTGPNLGCYFSALHWLLRWPYHARVLGPYVERTIRRGPSTAQATIRRGPSAVSQTIRRGPSEASSVIRRK